MRAVLLMCLTASVSLSRGQPPATPPGFEPIEQAFTAFLNHWAIPGAAIAVWKDGRLALERAYGLADVETGEPVQPGSLFRTASTGKTITAIAVMQLVEAGKLDLDAKAFEILAHIQPHSGYIRDPRVAAITVRQLLQHTGGWDSFRSGDPLVTNTMLRIADELRAPYPVPCETIIAYLLDRNLDFDPGSRMAYSNAGYCMLGKIVGAVTGEPFAGYVKRQILEPLGITEMRLTTGRLADRAEGEVRYYDYPGAPPASAITPGAPVPESGMLPFESMESVGAWIASASDLARIYVMLDRGRPPFLLEADTIRRMLAPAAYLTGNVQAERPGGPVGVSYYGLGLVVDRIEGDFIWHHSGGCPGTRAHVERLPNGIVWAALFNSAPRQPEGYPDFDTHLRRIFSQAALESVDWPK